MTRRRSVVLRVDGYNQASPGPSGNQGQMMGMSGRGGPIPPEGTANLGTPLMSENGAMVTYPSDTPQDHNDCSMFLNLLSLSPFSDWLLSDGDAPAPLVTIPRHSAKR